MAFVTFDFNVAGLHQYERAFEVLEADSHDMREPLRDAGHVIQHSVGEQFLTEGEHGLGHEWQPLSPEYAVWKHAHFPGRPLLVQTGEMRAELTTDASIKELTADRLVYGSDLDRAYWHQVGAGNNPARPMIALTLADRRDIDRAFVEWFSSRKRRAIGVP